MTTSIGLPDVAFAAGRRLWRIAWLLLALAAGLLLFARGLTRTDEGRNAEVAREMIAPGGDFWQMRLMGVRYYEKPPLAYWMIAASMKLFGIDDAAARLPLLLSMVAMMALCFRCARREWGADAAKLGSAAIASCTGVAVGMSILLTDPPLVVFFSATCLFLFEAYRRGGEGRRWTWLLAAAAAAWSGVLTKGFIAIVLPGAILILWLLWERRLSDFWRWSLIPVGLLFLAALGAMLWNVEQHNPGFNYRFVVNEHVQRFIGTRAIQLHPEAAWFYIPVLPGLLCPWALFIPRAIRGIRANRDLQRDSFSRFLVVWAAVVFLFFSAGRGKLMTYILPMLLPSVLLLTRRGLLPARAAADPADRRLWAIGAFLPLLFPLFVALFWALARSGALASSLGAPARILLVPVAAALGVWAWVWLRGHWKTISGLFLSVAASYAALGVLASPLSGPDFLAVIDDNRSFFQEASRHLRPQDELVLCKRYIPAMAFYLGRVPWRYCVDDELAEGMKMEPGLPGIFHASSELDSAMKQGPCRNFYAVLMKKSRAQLEQEGLRFAPGILAEDRELVLLKLMTPMNSDGFVESKDGDENPLAFKPEAEPGAERLTSQPG